MQLSDIRAEILAHGFDPGLFSTARLNSFINDGYLSICRRLQYPGDEATQTITTTTGTATYTAPTNSIRIRSLVDTDNHRDLQAISLRRIDDSSTTQGTPFYYAFDGPNLRLYPTPDGTHNLLLRYWALPASLSNDTDVPILPADTHNILWVYGVWQCYEAEDDDQNGQYWQQRFNTQLAELEAQLRFPGEYPTQSESMWGEEPLVGSNSWTYWNF